MTDSPRHDAIYSSIHAPIHVSVERDDARWTLVLRREFPQGPERLWSMLTDPARLARWSPIVPDRPLTSTGPATCRENQGDEPVDAEVLVVDSPRHLVHRWGPYVLSWTITAADGGSLLELRQSLASSHEAVLAAGWQVCFGRLAIDREGTELERVVGRRALAYGWQELHDKYAAEFRPMLSEEKAEPQPRLRGLFLTSNEPRALAEWYRVVARIPLEEVGEGYVYWRVDSDGVQLAIHDAEAFAGYAFPPRPDSNLTHLYFQVPDVNAFVSHLREHGIEPHALDDVVVTVTDPDGRKVMFGTA